MKTPIQILKDELEEMREEFPYFLRDRNRVMDNILHRRMIVDRIVEMKEMKKCIGLLTKIDSAKVECECLREIRKNN